MSDTFQIRRTGGPLPNRTLVTVVSLAGVAGITGLMCWMFWRQNGLREAWNWSAASSGIATACVVLFASWGCLTVIFRRKFPARETRRGPTPPYRVDEYKAVGLGALPDSESGRNLYLDLMKRCVMNVLYEDYPVFFSMGPNQWEVAQEFDLQHRVNGTDGPTQAHTMIGLHRLNHIQSCIESIIEDRVPGDFAETGSFRGGATIFMRAVLKAHEVTDRKIYVCDAFVPPQPQLVPRMFLPLLQAVASIPGKAAQRSVFSVLERMPQKNRAFPLCENPQDDWITFVMWALRHPETIQCGDITSLEHVKSRFARYGLLDDQVVFVPGYFAEALPQAPIGQLALLRLDGDTFESTHDAITELYPKLAPGGFCIIDDYHAFDDCERAVTEYREQHQIDEEIHTIDSCCAFWRKKV